MLLIGVPRSSRGQCPWPSGPLALLKGGGTIGPAIELLGSPAVRWDGGEADPPRDRKTWGLLAYLVLAERPPSRQRLAELLFPETADPLAAVRWSLAQLRRLLGDPTVVSGDPLVLQVPARTTIDVDVLLRDTWSEAVKLPTLEHELLEGLTFSSAPSFELWLTAARRRMRAAAAAMLHEAALANLASAPNDAVTYAERLVQVDPLDENHHVLLIRALATNGQAADASARTDDCIAFFARELGIRPSGALRDALATPPAAAPRTPTRPSVRAQLDTAEALVSAGSWAQGIDLYRKSVANARTLSDPAVLSRCLIGLGSALVHASRGGDEEGAASLHEAGEIAERCGAGPLTATAWRELAWVEFLRGRHDRARFWLDRAGTATEVEPTDQAWIAVISGGCNTDRGHYDLAARDLQRAIEIAKAADLLAPMAFALSLLGRIHLLREEFDLAATALRGSIQHARHLAWTSMIPWPESLLAEVELRRGNVDVAAEMFEHAFAMSRQLGDPCWESIGARGLGLVAVARGDLDGGIGLLEQAPALCRRLPDSYLWIEAYALEALCATAVEHKLPGTARWLDELEQIAARADFVELRIRALLHRVQAGEAGAYEAARAGAEGIENPALQRLLAPNCERQPRAGATRGGIRSGADSR